MSKSDDDNRSNQLNPNNDAYWSSRGMDRSGGDDDWGGGSPGPAHSFGRVFSAHLSRVQGMGDSLVPVYLDFILLSGKTVHLTFNVVFPGYAVSGRNREQSLDVVENLYDYIAACSAANYGEVVAWGEVHDCRDRHVDWLGSHRGSPAFAWPSRDAYERREMIKTQWASREDEAVAHLHAMLLAGAAAVPRITIGQANHTAVRGRRDRVPLQFEAAPA